MAGKGFCLQNNANFCQNRSISLRFRDKHVFDLDLDLLVIQDHMKGY